MKRLSLLIFGAFILLCNVFACEIGRKLDWAKNEINIFISTKDAKFGIACIVDGKDTLQINGNKEFPMLSVYKFPQSVAFLQYCADNNISMQDSINIAQSEMKKDTYSPMRDRYGVKALKLPIKELLYYSLAESDNNACDILFNRMGGPAYADSIISGIGYGDINIRYTEDEMHQDINRCYENNCTPLEMSRFIDYFKGELVQTTIDYGYIASIMESCKTGADRIAKSLIQTDAIIGHKTGTGDKNSDNRIIGVNDAGYVKFQGNHSYSISVFVADSNYSLEETSSFIAAISEIIWKNLQ